VGDAVWSMSLEFILGILTVLEVGREKTLFNTLSGCGLS